MIETRSALVALAAAALAACGGNGTKPPGMTQPPACNVQVSALGSDPGAMGACVNQAMIDVYTPPVTKSDNAIVTKIMDGNPAPPIKGNNEWTLLVTDESCKPLDGATIQVTPFMPAHGHGTSVKPTVTPMGNGLYKVSEINLYMPGTWRTTFDITVPGASAPASVQYFFCVDG
jgi:hypothetical protein